MPDPTPVVEAARLEALGRYDILDSEAEGDFECPSGKAA